MNKDTFWLLCLVCRGKTRDRIRKDTVFKISQW